MVYGIGPEDDFDDLVEFSDQMALTYPILYDQDGVVHEAYTQQNAVAAAYPEDWIIAADGTVAYVNNIFDVDAMIAIIEQEL